MRMESIAEEIEENGCCTGGEFTKEGKRGKRGKFCVDMKVFVTVGTTEFDTLVKLASNEEFLQVG